MGTMSRTMRRFMVQYCSLSGQLPEWIYGMTNLEWLGLGGNDLTGEVSPDIQRLTSLVTLGLDDNNFKGDIHIFAPLTNLSRLYLDQNAFDGTLDVAWMD